MSSSDRELVKPKELLVVVGGVVGVPVEQKYKVDFQSDLLYSRLTYLQAGCKL